MRAIFSMMSRKRCAACSEDTNTLTGYLGAQVGATCGECHEIDAAIDQFSEAPPQTGKRNQSELAVSIQLDRKVDIR